MNPCRVPCEAGGLRAYIRVLPVPRSSLFNNFLQNRTYEIKTFIFYHSVLLFSSRSGRRVQCDPQHTGSLSPGN